MTPFLDLAEGSSLAADGATETFMAGYSLRYFGDVTR
jgi:hypothetical protein